MIYNFNQKIRVKLTELGLQIVRQQNQQRNVSVSGAYYYYTEHLWSFMYYFGHQMVMGGPYPVDGMDFEMLPELNYPKPSPQLITPQTETELHARIINLFLDGNSLNQIGKLLEYEVSIDIVNHVIREEVARGRELRKKIRDLTSY